MARANIQLIAAIRSAANKIQQAKDYQWGHMGFCNCGHLVQELTTLTPQQIHDYALANCMGDWSEQSQMFCGTGSMPMDLLFSELIQKGMDMQDIKYLEKCCDPAVLEQMPENKKYPKNNVKEDVVLYMSTWANLLEDQLLNNLNINVEQLMKIEESV